MKAVIYKSYGAPKVAFISAIAKPVPKEDELLVKVYASTVNRTDAAFRSAAYFIMRFWAGFFKPKHQVLGCEFAGVVESVGNKVTNFKIGDAVFGYNDKTFGGHAEFLTISAVAAVTHKPANVSIYEAAALTEGSHVALNIIRAANLQKGNDVLVYGATGAIGSAAVQLLQLQGMKVTAVGNTKNVDLLKNMGAAMVIDYQQTDFTQINKTFDFIFDAVGKSNFAACKPLLKANGRYISTELGSYCENVYLAIKHSILKSNQRVLFPIPPDLSQQDVMYLRELVESGAFKPVIDSYQKMHDIVSVYHYVDSGQKTGNVILEVVDQSSSLS